MNYLLRAVNVYWGAHESQMFGSENVESLAQVLHFRVSEVAVNGVTCVKGHELILAASVDTSVHMFNYKGGLVGTFGLHEWVLDDISTHQDPEAQKGIPVLDAVEALCSVAAVREAAPGMALWQGVISVFTTPHLHFVLAHL